MTGTGTIENPFDLVTALTSGRVGAGDTLLLRAGTYSGDFVCSISGTPAAPITIKPAPGESAIIDGSLKIIGQQVRVENLEIKNTSWLTRESAETGSAPTDIAQMFGISVHNIGNKVINCKVHNAKLGIYIDDGADDFELYGCLFWDNGWTAPDGGHGHTIYYHGKNKLRTVKNCISMQDFSDYGLHIYNANSIINHLVENNIHVSRKIIIGSQYGFTGNIAVKNNCFYGETFQVGYAINNNYGLLMTGNYIAQHANIYNFQDATIQGNTFEIGGQLNITYPAEHADYALDNTFSATGADRVVVYQNAYDAERVNIAVYNYSLANSVSVDLSNTGLIAGHSYVLRQCQDPMTDVIEFVYDGEGITVDMQAANHSVSVPIGHNVSLDGKTFPQFGAFLIEAQ